jgi:hypothetical protein
MVGAAGQRPDQPAIDGAEENVAAAQAVGDGRAVAKQPAQLAGGEGGVEVEAGLAADQRERAIVAQLLQLGVAAPALPDDGGDLSP